MTSKPDVSGESRSMYRPLVTGLMMVASSFFTMFISVWVFTLFFQQNLSGITLWLVVLLIPCLFLLLLLFKSTAGTQHAFKVISGWAMVPLLSVLGLVVQFEFNEQSISTMILVDLVTILGVFNAQLDLFQCKRNAMGIQARAMGGNQSAVNPWFLAGMAIPFIILAHLLLLVPRIELVFFGAAGTQVIRASMLLCNAPAGIQDLNTREMDTVLHASPGEKPARKKHERNPIGDLWLGFCARLIPLAGNLLLPHYVMSERGVPAWGYWIMGLALGMALLSGFKKIDTKVAAMIATIGFLSISILFWLDWTILMTEPVMLASGVLGGVSWVWFLDGLARWNGRIPRVKPTQFFHASFWIVVISVSLGLGAHEMKFLVLDHASRMWLLPVVACGMVGVVLLFTRLQGRRHLKLKHKGKTGIKARHQSRIPSSSSTFLPFKVQGKEKKKILAISLCMITLTATTCAMLQFNSRAAIRRIQLGTVMYDVHGNPVSSVTLKERSAKILLNSPFPEGIAHDELIRPGKTVRIGAYLYDAHAIGNFTNESARNWIASTMDVYSLGGYANYTIFPEDVQVMRNINNNTRFYIMNFATTLGEYDNWTVDGPLGNATSEWNATMDEWTLKRNDGSESTGVRRGSDDSTGHLMDLGSPGWAGYYAWVWNNRVDAYNATGVAIDEVMWRGYWGTEVSNLRDYSSIPEITETCYQWLEWVKGNSTHEIISQAFWDEAQQYQDGIWGELAFRSGGAYGNRVDDRQAVVFYETMNWTGIVENMVSQGEQDRSYIWAAWYNREDAGALEYCVATYLMGKVNNCTSVVFHPQPTYDGGYPYNLAGYSLETVRQELRAHPEFFDLELGDALGPMVLKDGAGGQYFQRNFTNGIVLVNPFHGFVPGFDYTPPENPSH